MATPLVQRVCSKCKLQPCERYGRSQTKWRKTCQRCTEHFCYILTDSKRHFYRGYTVDPPHRLRQHRGELAGGARATRKWKSNGGIEFAALIRGFRGQHDALRFEWFLKHDRPRARTLKQAIQKAKNLIDRHNYPLFAEY